MAQAPSQYELMFCFIFFAKMVFATCILDFSPIYHSFEIVVEIVDQNELG